MYIFYFSFNSNTTYVLLVLVKNIVVWSIVLVAYMWFSSFKKYIIEYAEALCEKETKFKLSAKTHYWVIENSKTVLWTNQIHKSADSVKWGDSK